MKPFLLSLFLTVALCSSRLAAGELTIETQDAAQHVGQTVVVRSTVAEVRTFKGGSIALDFGAKSPHDVFEVYIPVNLVSVTGNMYGYEWKAMVVEASIILYKGKPESKLQKKACERGGGKENSATI